MRKACPCDPSRLYSACCGRYHSGQQTPPTAEALMRSRYSAFVLNDNAYLFKSWHSETRPARKSISSLPECEWLGLNVLGTQEGGEGDEVGIVEFVATFVADGQIEQLHEVSRFSREKGKWRYLGPASH